MTRDFNGPRAGSRAYKALEMLYSMGGQATFADWMRAADWRDSVLEFERLVVGSLTVKRHIFKRGANHVITDGGMVHIGQMDLPKATPIVVAGPRYVPPKRPLSARHLVSVRPMREGALDYREIPSRIGDHRIAHGAKAVAADA